MRVKPLYVLMCVAFIAGSLATTGCNDDGDGTTPGESAFHRQEPLTFNTRRCPEVEDTAALQFDEGFQSQENLDKMTKTFNKSYGLDTFAHPGDAQVVTGRFYSDKTTLPGGVGNPTGPSGEPVALFAQNDDGNWTTLATTNTTDDGNFSVTLPDDAAFGHGGHRVLAVLKADGTCVEQGVFVYPEGQDMVASDIDATLTTLDSEFLAQMSNWELVPDKLPGSVDLTNAWVNKGYVLFYLTARPLDYQSLTRVWLREEGYPFGPVTTAPGFVHGDSAATFKGDTLKNAQSDLGWVFDYAYGNAFSDTTAYVDAGIAKDHIFMVNEAGCPPSSTDSECEDYKDQEGVAYLDTVAIQPNKDYSEHVENYVPTQPDAGE